MRKMQVWCNNGWEFSKTYSGDFGLILGLGRPPWLLEWVAMSSSRESFQSRDRMQVLLHCRCILYHMSPREPPPPQKKITRWIEAALWASNTTTVKKATLVRYILVRIYKTKTIFKAGSKKKKKKRHYFQKRNSNTESCLLTEKIKKIINNQNMSLREHHCNPEFYTQ